MTPREVGQRNKAIHEHQEFLRRTRYRKCLFTDDCPEEVINAHSISRAVLEHIQDERHVVSPEMKFDKDEQGLSRPSVSFSSVGIGQASTGTFVCDTHDNTSKAIDVTPMDLDDSKARDLLLYRAVLREMWVLLRTRPAAAFLNEFVPFLHNPTNHPETRLESLVYLRDCIRRRLNIGTSIGEVGHVSHMVRRVKSDYPILACSYASGGSVKAFDPKEDKTLGVQDIRRLAGIEPYTCWGITIIPQPQEHTVLISWLEGSHAQTYFDHIKKANNRELEEAV